MKCGVMVLDLIPEESIQYGMFDKADRDKDRLVMQTIDKVNKSLGREIVRFAVQGFEKKYHLRAEYLSKKYTTDIKEVLHVKN